MMTVYIPYEFGHAIAYSYHLEEDVIIKSLYEKYKHGFENTTEMRISTENARITIAMPLDMMMELLRICIQRYPYLIL